MGLVPSSSETPKAFTLPIGAVSPLWLAFAGAAGMGVAYWWMTRWTRPIRGEAEVLEFPVIATPSPAAPVVEAAAPEPVALAVVEPVVEAVAEPAPTATPEPVPTPVVEAVKVEAPQIETPKVDAPRTAAPKAAAKPKAIETKAAVATLAKPKAPARKTATAKPSPKASTKPA